jgi:hypothetical protein
MGPVFALIGAVFVIGGIVIGLEWRWLAAIPSFLIGVMAFAIAVLFQRLASVTGRLERLEHITSDTVAAVAAPTEERPKKVAAVAETAAEHSEEAAILLRKAQDHHFDKHFAVAKKLYADVVEQFPRSKQAITARAQMENLKKSS